MKRLLLSLFVLALVPETAISQTAISALPAATTPLAGTEVVPIVQSGATKNVTAANIQQGGSFTANKVLASPNGSSGAPTFRALTTADMAALLSASNGWSSPQSLISSVTPTTDGANTTVQNSSKTAYQIYSPVVPAGYYFYDSARAVVDLETGTAVQNADGFGAYTYNAVAQGSNPNQKNAVGFFAVGIDAVDNAATWGVNTACNDNTANGAATLNGRKCIGYEADFTINGASTVQGVSMIMQGPGTPAGAAAFSASISSGATAKWIYAYTSGNGASTNFASIGASAVSGTNIASQPVFMNSFDGSGSAYAVEFQALNHALIVTDNTLSNGVSLVASNSNPGVYVNGSGNANLVLSSLGTGAITPVSPIVSSKYISGPALAGTGTATFSVNSNAGTGATISCAGGYACNGVSGTVTLTTGTGPSSGWVFTLSLPAATTFYHSCVVQGASSTAIAPLAQGSTSTTAVQFNVLTALAASTAYTVNYICGGY